MAPARAKITVITEYLSYYMDYLSYYQPTPPITRAREEGL